MSDPKFKAPSVITGKSYDDYLKGYGAHMVGEVFRFIEARKKDYGPSFAQHLSSAFLSQLVSAIVYDALKHKPEAQAKESKEKMIEQVFKNLANAKVDVQESVAKGVSEAMSAFSNREIEYYCVVAPVPEAKSKTLN